MRISFHIPTLALGLLLFGCGGRYKPAQPVEMTPEACCTAADAEFQNFAGCRVTGRCRQGEVFWMRGAVTCGPVDDQSCGGGRCCHYRARYGLPGATPTDEDANSTPAEATPPPAEVTPPPEPAESEPAAEPTGGIDEPAEDGAEGPEASPPAE